MGATNGFFHKPPGKLHTQDRWALENKPFVPRAQVSKAINLASGFRPVKIPNLFFG
jgi:hypothetical protein